MNIRKRINDILIFGLALGVTGLFFLSVEAQIESVLNLTPDNLKSAIEEKSKQLSEINKQIQNTEENLNQTINKSTTIQKDISKLTNNVKTLTLRIKAGEITIEKLSLELEDLNGQIDETRQSVAQKKDGIAAALRTLQQKDNESMLIVLLRTKSLAESVSEAQNLSDVNASLASEIADLRALEDILSQKISEESQKKSAIESEHRNATNQKGIVEEQKTERQKLLSFTKTQQKSYEVQLSELQKQQEDISDQIDALDAELRKNFNESVLPGKRPGVLIMPVQGKITQNWGEVSRLYRGKPHNGLDIGAPIGTPIYAARDGQVTTVSNNGRLQYGKYVLIEHDNGLSTLYAHMSRQAAVTGQIVKRGELIGYVGNTGYSFGAHLHLGLYWTASIKLQSFSGAGIVPVGVTLNPRDYI